MKTILVCDDEPEMRSAIALCLSTAYRVVEARDGKEALSLIDSERPDLVLLDASMPGMTGLGLLKNFRAKHPKLPAIMLSGRQSVAIARRALRLGARAFITKPFDADLLRAEIKRVLELGSNDDAPPWRVKL
jgi:DNA-binding response OmpR family regulator